MEKFKHVFSSASSRMFLAFAGIAIAGIFLFVFFSGSSETASKSVVRPVPVTGETKTSPVSPAYLQAVGSADQKRVDTAQATGASALPSIVVTSKKTETEAAELLRPSEVVNPGSVRPVPGSEGGSITSMGTRTPAPAPGAPGYSPGAPGYTPDQVEAIKTQMKSLMAARQAADPATAIVYNEPKTQAPEDSFSRASTEQAARPPLKSDGKGEVNISLPLPGTVVYAELIGRANSDSPGPVIARILQGPYTGAIAVGSFEKGRDTLAIRFSKMSVASTSDGSDINSSLGISAVAVDTRYIGTGLATDVDHHYFAKIATAFTTSFLQGMGQAISNSGSTTTTNSGTTTTTNPGLSGAEKALVATGTAAGAVGQILNQEFGSRPTTVIVEAGTPIGILFL